jgi:hypothetical protein
MWIGLACEYFIWIKDWWHPITVTGTPIGIEDLVMCFTHVGIPIFIYKYTFGRDTIKNKLVSKKESAKRLLLLLLIIFFPLLALFYCFNVHSFFATSIGMMLGGLYIILRRKDLIPAALWNSVLMVALTFPVYIIGNFTSPGVIKALWDPRISGIFILGIPIEDIVWYAILGFLWGGIHEYTINSPLKYSRTNNLFSDILLIFNYILKKISK